MIVTYSPSFDAPLGNIDGQVCDDAGGCFGEVPLGVGLESMTCATLGLYEDIDDQLVALFDSRKPSHLILIADIENKEVFEIGHGSDRVKIRTVLERLSKEKGMRFSLVGGYHIPSAAFMEIFPPPGDIGINRPEHE